MLSRLRNMFRVPDLRNKILFTIFIIAVYRLGAHLPVPYVDFSAIKELQNQAEQQRRRRLPRPLLRWGDHQRRDLLPRDHAVHHGVDHHAAARRGDPEARAVAERGPGRPEEDHAVDPLRHHRPSRSCSRPASCSPCTRARAACSASPASTARTSSRTSTPRAALIVLTWTAGTADGDVARRAHHPARHRQRHVDPDLRVGGVAPPRAGRRDLEPRAASSSSSRSSPSASR